MSIRYWGAVAVLALLLGMTENVAAEPLQFGNGSTWLTVDSLPFGNPMLGDVNGDGKADLVFERPQGSGPEVRNQILVSRSTGTNFLAPEVWSENACPQKDGCVIYALADVNGDGNADLIAFKYRQIGRMFGSHYRMERNFFLQNYGIAVFVFENRYALSPM
jgi:hypothetical protein